MQFPPIREAHTDFTSLLDHLRHRLERARAEDPDGRFESWPWRIRSGSSDLRPEAGWYEPRALIVAGAGVLTLAPGLLLDLQWITLLGAAIAGLGLIATIYGRVTFTGPMRRWHEECELVTAALVEADSDLLEHPGEHNRGTAVLVITWDRVLERDPDRMSELADEILELPDRDESELPRDAHALRRFLRDRRESATGFRRIKVPRSFAEAGSTYVVETMIERKCLPSGFLDRRIWFALARDADESVALAPIELWWNSDDEHLFEVESPLEVLEDFLEADDAVIEIEEPPRRERARTQRRLP